MRIILALIALCSAPPVFGAPREGPICCFPGPGSRLDRIIIPKVDLRNVTVEEAIEFLRRETKRLDPEGAGVNFVLKTNPATPSKTPPSRTPQQAAPAR
jgi:hypothetical protein